MKSRFRILIPFFLFAVALAFPSVCTAQLYEQEAAPLPLEQEPWVVSGHPVGDTIGRGIDFLLRPVYSGAGGLYFFLFEPPEPKQITELQMLDCPPQFIPPAAPVPQAQPAAPPVPVPPVQPAPPAMPPAPPPSPEPGLQP